MFSMNTPVTIHVIVDTDTVQLYYYKCTNYSLGQGGSHYACSDIYHGVDEFSEQETKSVSAYITKYMGTWHSYFSFHRLVLP